MTYVGATPERLDRLSDSLERASLEIRSIRHEISRALVPISKPNPAEDTLVRVENWAIEQSLDVGGRAVEVQRGPDLLRPFEWLNRNRVTSLADPLLDALDGGRAAPTAAPLVGAYLRMFKALRAYREASIVDVVYAEIRTGNQLFAHTRSVVIAQRTTVTLGAGAVHVAAGELDAARAAHNAASAPTRLAKVATVIAPISIGMDIETMIHPDHDGLWGNVDRGMAGASAAATLVGLVGVGGLVGAGAPIVLAGTAAYFLSTWMYDNREMLASAAVAAGTWYGRNVLAPQVDVMGDAIGELAQTWGEQLEAAGAVVDATGDLVDGVGDWAADGLRDAVEDLAEEFGPAGEIVQLAGEGVAAVIDSAGDLAAGAAGVAGAGLRAGGDLLSDGGSALKGAGEAVKGWFD